LKFEAFERIPKEKQESIIAAGMAEFAVKSYADASTDRITETCGISKGLLFHYFGSKKEFYLFCLSAALEKLIADDPAGGEEEIPADFYEILFSYMDKKFSQCMKFRNEMHMVNMAARDSSAAITQGKARVMLKYRTAIALTNEKIMNAAVAALPTGIDNRVLVQEGLLMYISAVINKYLVIYREIPEEFFKKSEEIKAEFKEYIDLMLYGVISKESEEQD